MEMKDDQSPNVLSELRIFIGGATRTVKCNELDLARTSLTLLKTLPASRDAVLEYFCSVFDTSVKKYVFQVENDQLMNAPVPLSQQEDAVITEIYSVLCNFVTSNPEAWAPIISAWSLQLLGEVSSHYNHLPSSVGLNEALHWWMSCKAARSLVDITTQCLSCLIDSDTETCINALLDTSVAHSPHFDWVVAHVGSCFPQTVITRVLSCGLKDFCAKGNMSSSNKSAKFNSVVGILGHLASSHFINIKTALLELFEWNLVESTTDALQRSAVVPYLLQLASKSNILLRALSTDVLHTLNMETLSRLAELAPTWQHYFRDDTERLEDLVVHLALGCGQGGAKIMYLLLDGTRYPREEVATTCHVLLELLLEDIDVQLRSYRHTSIPFLESIKTELSQVQRLLLSEDTLKQQSACRLLRLMGSVNPSVVIDSVSHLLLLGSNPSHMAALAQLMTSRTLDAGEEKTVLALALEQALRAVSNQERQKAARLWDNVSTLLRHESSSDTTLISAAVSHNLPPLSDLLSSSRDPPTLHAVASVMDLLPPQCFASLPLQLMVRIAKNCVKYFFVCVKENDRFLKTTSCRRACTLLTRLSTRSTVARSLALRELLEASLFLPAGALFGARAQPRSVSEGYLLMQQNHRLGATTLIAQRQSSVFGNAGSSAGGKDKVPDSQLSPELVEENTLHLIQAIQACCVDNSLQESGSLCLDAIIQVALLLVQLITPDVMYNGLPWPEEEFCKVTVERDVSIRKTFDEHPLAWRLLELVSLNEPALCYTSILLRALAATLLSQWASASTQGSVSVSTSTVRLLRIMAVGQLLPPPLASLHVVVPGLTPSEVVMLLRDCVWSYMRDNVPSPALFQRDPRSNLMWRDSSLARPAPQYTESLRLVLQNNIAQFGALYAKLFVHS